MNKHTRWITGELEKHSRDGTGYWSNDSYMSSGHSYYDVSVPDCRRICTAWLANNPDLSFSDFTKTLDELYRGKSYEERSMAGRLLGYHSSFRHQVSFTQLETWLGQLVGWGEVDSTCQSTWTPGELLADWVGWKQFLLRLSQDENINVRRASLVLLTNPVSTSDDERIRDLCFTLIGDLQGERDILITKAVSWLLRCMVTHHSQVVTDYLDQHSQTLSAIALRETRNKIRTGRK